MIISASGSQTSSNRPAAASSAFAAEGWRSGRKDCRGFGRQLVRRRPGGPVNRAVPNGQLFTDEPSGALLALARHVVALVGAQAVEVVLPADR